jgi:hypothetical protein
MHCSEYDGIRAREILRFIVVFIVRLRAASSMLQAFFYRVYNP